MNLASKIPFKFLTGLSEDPLFEISLIFMERERDIEKIFDCEKKFKRKKDTSRVIKQKF